MLDILGSKIDYVFEDQSKGRTFVAIHGFNSYHQRVSQVLKEEVLRAGYNYLAFSLPGHGSSEGRVEDMTFSHLCDVVVAVIEQFKLREITLFGHSLGGGLVLASVKRLRERLDSVIVVGTISRNSEAKKQLLAASFLPTDFEGLKRLANLIYYFGEHFFRDEAVKSRALAELDFFNSDPTRRQRMQHLIDDMMADTSIEDRIDSGIKLSPKLYLGVGEGDKVVAEGIGEYFKELNPATSFKLFPRAGHSPWDEDAEGFITWFRSVI